MEAFFAAAGLGPEPFALDPADFRAAARPTGRTLKAVLLDQTVVAGVGNIYADEALHRAGLHPERRGNTVTAAEADRLREAVAAVLTAAIARPRLDDPRLRRRVRPARRLPGRAPGLRPDRRAVPHVRNRDCGRAGGRPVVTLLHRCQPLGKPKKGGRPA